MQIGKRGYPYPVLNNARNFNGFTNGTYSIEFDELEENGKYLIVFNSIYDENNCDLELYYLDDKGGKYTPNVNSAYINGNPVKIDNNKIKNFSIQNGARYKIEINTDLDDLYACEVRIYANR